MIYDQAIAFAWGTVTGAIIVIGIVKWRISKR